MAEVVAGAQPGGAGSTSGAQPGGAGASPTTQQAPAGGTGPDVTAELAAIKAQYAELDSRYKALKAQLPATDAGKSSEGDKSASRVKGKDTAENPTETIAALVKAAMDEALAPIREAQAQVAKQSEAEALRKAWAASGGKRPEDADLFAERLKNAKGSDGKPLPIDQAIEQVKNDDVFKSFFQAPTVKSSPGGTSGKPNGVSAENVVSMFHKLNAEGKTDEAKRLYAQYPVLLRRA